ncbi:unnamed protein product [Trifolium pratense]|uniref:Uncharacterized protein n=1 Tax=Trifolium pratense TaxID=57577 RepID=A0ACB0IRS4_TRIPR|nr:unnamed protein product [Trifolium pratense]
MRNLRQLISYVSTCVLEVQHATCYSFHVASVYNKIKAVLLCVGHRLLIDSSAYLYKYNVASSGQLWFEILRNHIFRLLFVVLISLYITLIILYRMKGNSVLFRRLGYFVSFVIKPRKQSGILNQFYQQLDVLTVVAFLSIVF